MCKLDLESSRASLEPNQESNVSSDLMSFRILELANNPLTETNRIYAHSNETLCAENKELRALLASPLNFSPAQQTLVSSDPSIQACLKPHFDVLQSDKESIKVKLQDAEKRLVRLREMFSSKIESFREAVASLFGYGIDYTDDRIKLTCNFQTQLGLYPELVVVRDPHSRTWTIYSTSIEGITMPFSLLIFHSPVVSDNNSNQQLPFYLSHLTLSLEVYNKSK